MSGVDIANIITVVVALFGGGVVGVVIKAFTEKKKLNAEANNTNIKSLLEIDQRMNERMAKLEARVANLEQENYKLKSDKLALEKETHRLEILITELETEKKELYEENCALKLELEIFKGGKNEKSVE
jgi:predicted RNase H-like nuclease (RuvC/YqgF family)